ELRTINMRWDGEGYHRVATVQERWGLQLLRQVPRANYLRSLDAGCGSGRLTAHLLRKFPEAHVIGLDVSGEMLDQARRNLRPFSASSQTRRGRSAYCKAGAEVRACFQQRRVPLDPRSHAPLPKHP